MTNMEQINGVTFEEYASACGQLAQGMSEEQVMSVLGMEKPVWADTLARWGQRLGELMTKDMAYATKYGELFADPHHGRFATAQGSATGISELLTLVPDHDTYERIFWHLAVASQHGVDTRSVLPEYGLDIGKWGTLNMHYMKQGLGGLDPDDPNYSERFQLLEARTQHWQRHWEEHFKDLKADLSSDITF